MKKILITIILLAAAGVVMAGSIVSDSIKNSSTAESYNNTYNTNSEAITLTAKAELPEFGAVAATFTTVCAHSKMKMTDWQTISPLSLSDRWYFRILHKEKTETPQFVTGLIDSHSAIKGLDYYYYFVPLENKGNVVRFTKEGAFIRSLKFPVFGFIFFDVLLEPEIQYMRFPLTEGDSWESKSTGTVELMNLFKINRLTTTKFKVLSGGDITINGKVEHVFRVSSEIDKGDGKISHEEDWYAVNIGLVYQNTEAYTLEIIKYAPGEAVIIEKNIPVDKL